MTPGVEQQALSPVTIMVPTYRQAAYLERSLESALAQDYPALEVLVSDDASPDNTAEIVEKFMPDPRLRYVRNERNLGRVGNYRESLQQRATGKYVLNLDGDDWLTDPTYIRRAVAILDVNQDVALVFANASSFRQSDRTYVPSALRNVGLTSVSDGNDLFLSYANDSVWIPHLTALYRRDVAIAIGFYRLDIIGSDMDSLLRMILGRKVGFIDDTVAVWRQHENNATKDVDYRRRLENLASVDSPYRAARDLSEIEFHRLERWRRLMLAKLSLDFLGAALHSHANRTALKYFVALIVQRPAVALGTIQAGLAWAGNRFVSRANFVGHE